MRAHDLPLRLQVNVSEELALEALAYRLQALLATTHDEIVVPYTSAFLSGLNTTNVTLQDKFPADTSEHLQTPYDTAAIQWTLDALSHSGPANPSFQPVCP